MTILFKVVAFLLALNPVLSAEGKPGELRLSEVGLQLLLVAPGGNGGVERISLVLTNTRGRNGLFRLPSAFVADDSSASSFAPFPPWLGLLVKDPKSGREEQFVFTTFAKLGGPAELVSLPKAKTIKLDYRLTSFYRWGPCDPDRYGSFHDYFKPGAVELEVRAMIFSEGVAERVLSNPQKLRSSFPEWLFKDHPTSDAVPTKSDENRPGETKTEPTPSRTGPSRR